MMMWADTHYVPQPLSSQVTCEFVDIVRDRYPVLSTASGNHHTPCFLHRVLQQQSDVFGGQTFQQNPTDPNSILLVCKCPITIFSSAPNKKKSNFYFHFTLFQHLEANIVTFVKNELKKFQKVWSSDDLECLDRQSEDEVLDGEEESREAFLKITLHFLRKMKQEDLAECLQSSKRMFHT